MAEVDGHLEDADTVVVCIEEVAPFVRPDLEVFAGVFFAKTVVFEEILDYGEEGEGCD